LKKTQKLCCQSNIISSQDQYRSQQESFSVSTTPSVSFSTNKQASTYLNEQTTLTIGHTTDTPLVMDTLQLQAGTMIAANDAHVQIDHVIAHEIRDQTVQSGFGTTNLNLTFSRGNSTAVNRPTILGDGVKISAVEGSLNTDADCRHELLEENHREIHADMSAAAVQRLVHPAPVRNVHEMSDERLANSKLYAVFSELVYETHGNVDSTNNKLKSYIDNDSNMDHLLDGWTVEQADKRAAVFVNHDTHSLAVAYRGKLFVCLFLFVYNSIF
jgi:hypothetical protein